MTHPTIAEIQSVNRGRPDTGLLLMFCRPVGSYFAWGALRLGLRPIHVSCFNFVLVLAACGMFAFGEPRWRLPAALLLILWQLLDATDGTMARAVLSIPLAIVSGQLFMIGHDAAHGSFSTSRKNNVVMGRLALLPSLHVFSLWRDHHNVHHKYTNLKSHDFVWTPLSVAEYRCLPWHRRLLHRIFHNRFGTGLGLHYAIEIWIPRMLWRNTVEH